MRLRLRLRLRLRVRVGVGGEHHGMHGLEHGEGGQAVGVAVERGEHVLAPARLAGGSQHEQVSAGDPALGLCAQRGHRLLG